MSAPRFEHFDRKVADALIRSQETTPGLQQWMGVRFLELEPGRLLAEMEVRDEHRTPFGTLHGGVMAGLVDHVLGCVLYPLMERGQWAATTEFKLNYLAAVREGALRAESSVAAMTKTTAVVRVEVHNQGRLACIAQGTLLVRTPRA